MTTVTDAQDEVLAEAERINEERMEVMRELAENVAHRRNLERQVREAEKEEKRLTAEAEKAGWTRRQVQRVVKPPRQTRASQSGATSGSQTQDTQQSDSPKNTEEADDNQ